MGAPGPRSPGEKPSRKAYQKAARINAPIFAFGNGFYRSSVKRAAAVDPGLRPDDAETVGAAKAALDKTVGDVSNVGMAKSQFDKKLAAAMGDEPGIPGLEVYSTKADKDHELLGDLEGSGANWAAQQAGGGVPFTPELSTAAERGEDPLAGAEHVAKVPAETEMKLPVTDIAAMAREKARRQAGVPTREVRTPETEKVLNESMFGKKNDEIFNRLKKLWAK